MKLAGRKLNLEPMRQVYLTQGGLTPEQFDKLEEGTRVINSLDLGGFEWHIPYLARDTHSEIPWATHLMAWAAGLSLPYSGIEDFYRRAINFGVLPPWSLNQTSFHESIGGMEKMALGRLLVRLGLVSVIELERALGIQALIREEAGVPARIGRILAAIAPLSLPDFTRALTIHLGIPYVSLEHTLPVVERAVAKR